MFQITEAKFVVDSPSVPIKDLLVKNSTCEYVITIQYSTYKYYILGEFLKSFEFTKITMNCNYYNNVKTNKLGNTQKRRLNQLTKKSEGWTLWLEKKGIH